MKIRLLAAIAAALLCASVHAQNQLNLDRDAGGFGNNTPYLLTAPTYTDARVLAAGVSETHTVPAGARFVVFSATCDFYAKTGASSAVPGADVTDGTASMLNPQGWALRGSVTQISVITAASSCVVTLAFYL